MLNLVYIAICTYWKVCRYELFYISNPSREYNGKRLVVRNSFTQKSETADLPEWIIQLLRRTYTVSASKG